MKRYTAYRCTAIVLCAIGLVVAGGATGCVSEPQTVLERLGEARRLTAEILLQFTKAADAANRAVMAETDEAAAASVHEADLARTAVQISVDQLRPTLAGLGYTNESRLLDEFAGRFSEYRELDRSILDLAVQSTNLKAQRLSFGPAQEAADALRDALEPVKTLVPATNQWRVEALAATVVLSVREIQALQAPHIAEPNDAPMTRIEKRMADSEARARKALTALSGIVPPAAQRNISTAVEALNRFMSLNAEILALSRRNSNVHALALSLGQKRTLVAACEESLRALQDALTKRGFTGTR
jgi:hypothetical protein